MSSRHKLKRSGPILEPRGQSETYLSDDQIMKVLENLVILLDMLKIRSHIEFFALQGTIHQANTMHMLSRTNAHTKNAILGHLIDEFLRYMFPLEKLAACN